MRSVHPWSFVVALLVACAGGLGGQNARPARDSDVQLADAPASAAAWKNPYAGQPEAIRAGQKLFKRHCAECHGPDGRGKGKAPDLRSSAVENATPGVLFWFLKNGNLKSGMPSWSRLPDQRLWQLVSYLNSLK
jgi:cytochrome c oxidase cbb3-type subunit 2